MSEINPNQVNSLLDQLGIQNKAEPKKKNDELGQAEFMKLLVAQMENQNPLEPQKNGEFIAQLAQFSSLESMEGMNNKMDGLVNALQSSQALQASALVGREVFVESSRAPMNGQGQINGSVELPASTSSLRVGIYSAQGALVRMLDFGQQAAGDIQFSWDGKDAAGNPLPPGNYGVKAEAIQNEVTEQLTTFLGANVDSVSIGQGQAMTLNLAGVGETPMSKVKQIF